MDKTNVTKRVTATILSMSLLTVMAGAAIAPALGIIKAHFSQANDLLVQLIVSMPALLIIVNQSMPADKGHCHYGAIALCDGRSGMFLRQ